MKKVNCISSKENCNELNCILLRYYHIEINICFKLLEIQLEEGDSISFTGDSFLVLQINDDEKGVMEETSPTDSNRTFNGSASIEFLVKFQISSNGYVLVPIKFECHLIISKD